jgi:hypothetical protein
MKTFIIAALTLLGFISSFVAFRDSEYGVVGIAIWSISLIGAVFVVRGDKQYDWPN